jgi:hypothetical protein
VNIFEEVPVQQREKATLTTDIVDMLDIWRNYRRISHYLYKNSRKGIVKKTKYLFNDISYIFSKQRFRRIYLKENLKY